MKTALLAGLGGLIGAGALGQPSLDPNDEAAAAMMREVALMQYLAEVEANKLPERFDLVFPGGTVGDYIEAIRAAHPSANIVATPEAVRFAMPAVSLKQVDTGAAAQIIARDIGDPSVGMSSLRVQEIEVKGSAESVYSVTARAQPPQTARTSVISLAAIVGPGGSNALKIEDVLSAIEAATNMTAPPPKIRFHAETSLLLFHGTAEQVSTLNQTLEALDRTASFAE